MQIMRCTDAALLADLNRDVQELHARDYPDLFKLYDKTASRSFFDGALSKGEWDHFVAYAEGRPLGFIQIEQRNILDHPFRRDCRLLYIHQICVLQKFEGMGVGKALINHVKAMADNLKIRRIELDVWAQNERSNRFYKGVGFVTIKSQMAMKEWES